MKQQLSIQASSYTNISIILLLTAVLFGAFGAHALKDMVEAARLVTWQTAVDYQMSQSLGLLIISLIKPDKSTTWFEWARKLLLIGVLIFSGSLYLLVLSELSWLGAITPIGGIAMISAWSSLLIHFLKG